MGSVNFRKPLLLNNVFSGAQVYYTSCENQENICFPSSAFFWEWSIAIL